MRQRYWLVLFAFVFAIAAKAQNDTVLFSTPGGFYEESFSVQLSNVLAGNHIRYTLNGNRPTAQSPLYEEPLLLDYSKYSRSDIYTVIDCPESSFYLPDSIQHCIVIRAAVFDGNDSCVSRVMTNSYFIRALGCDTHGLPVVSLCADSLDLFDYYRGIFVPGAWLSPNMPLWTGNYFHKGKEWERRCNVEFYESDNRGINQEAGLRTHGGASRRFQQKGMKLYAREEYGKKRFKHPFFDDSPIEKVKRLSLKPFRCSNWLQTGLNDVLCHHVARPLNIDVLGSRAVVVFLNGEYWGIYYLEEATDSHYLEDHYEIDPDSCNIIKNWQTLDEGDLTPWQQLYDWVEVSDLSDENNYAYLCSKIEMDNFIDYLVFELYSANVDWPANNVRCWQSGDSKWRWIFYDGDGCFFRDWDVFANIVDTSNNLGPSNAASTLFIRRLIENRAFVDNFTARFNELMSDVLTYESILPYYNTLRAEIEDEIPNQCERFRFPVNVERWEDDMTRLRDYLFGLNEQMQARLNGFCEQHHIGIADITKSFQCYPNPSSSEIHISITADTFGTNEISIYDMMGRKVFATTISNEVGVSEFTLNPNLSLGVYVLRVGELTQRIVRY